MHYTPSVDLAFVSVEHNIINTYHLAIIPTVLSRLKNGTFTKITTPSDTS
jgi:hypothetical protein